MEVNRVYCILWFKTFTFFYKVLKIFYIHINHNCYPSLKVKLYVLMAAFIRKGSSI